MKTVTKTFIWILLSLSLIANGANGYYNYKNREGLGSLYVAVVQSFQGVKVDMQFLYAEVTKLKGKSKS